VADVDQPLQQVFDPALVPPLVGTLSLTLQSEHTRLALIALTVRNEGTLTYFLDEIRKELEIAEVDSTATSILLSEVLDQVDTGLPVKIFKISRAK